MQNKNNSILFYIKIFFVAFFSMCLILLPNIIYNHGVFLYAGDYYFQQIPFYVHAVKVVDEFGIGWDWYTDLGSDFITTYSYYLTGSIFFWAISWLKSTTIIYAMPVMIALKAAIATIGAYAYINRYVSDKYISALCAYMYAFSGFQMASLVFNTFMEITALFPFLLLSFDLLVKDNKKIFFAFMTALVALTNYYFFVGIVIFVFLYYIVGCIKKEFFFSISNFLSIAFESLIGIGVASVILIPTFMVLSSADRVGDTLYGVDLVSYSDNTIIPKIFQSLFLVPDPPSSGMLFKSIDNTHNWASISLYLPVFTITGVAVYITKQKNDWLSYMLKICLVIALIPGLNSIFSLFNSSYYARWYYMPILLMCLATAKSLENAYDLTFGIKIVGGGLGLLALIACLPDKVVIEDSERLSALLKVGKDYKTELRFFSLSQIPIVFWQSIVFSVVSLLIIYIFNRKKINGIAIITLKKLSLIIGCFVIITYIIFINNTVQELGFDREDNTCYKLLMESEPNFNDEDTFRITTVNGGAYNNLSMIWNMMNVGCFNSIEANEIDEFFCKSQGDERRMLGEYKASDYPAYGLLSVKYILNESTGDDLNVELNPVELKGFSLYDKQGSYYIYKNDYFVPFGVSYEYCIDDETLEKYLEENIDEDNKYQYKKMSMMRALVLDKDDIEEYKDYIKPLPEYMLESLDEQTYFYDCEQMSANSCTSFEYNSKGYQAIITVDRPSLVYFSVPCSAGWKAKVNGNNVEVIKAHYGLTAVAVEQGNNKIEFSYETPGLREGWKITFASCIVLVVYIIINMIIRKINVSEKNKRRGENVCVDR